jgi:hypothetical protein
MGGMKMVVTPIMGRE